MANKTKVKRDAHGLYVRGGGYVFRPFASRLNYYHSGAINDGHTEHKEGDAVSVHHLAQTPYGDVRSTARTEMWHAHGSYIGPDCRAIPSADVWDPRRTA